MTATGGTTGPGSKSPVKIFANIFISFIGAGVLGLPFAFKEAGILEGAIVMSVVGIISVKAMLLLIDCKYRILEKYKPPIKKHDGHTTEISVDQTEETEGLINGEVLTDPDMEIEKNDFTQDGRNGFCNFANFKSSQEPANTEITYGDVGYQAIGHAGRMLVDMAIVISQTGFCCAYIIFITENLSAYFPNMKMQVWLLILLPPLSILTLARHLGGLAITSLLAQCSNLFAFAVVLWFDFEHLHTINVHPKKMKIQGLPFFLAISIYCYEGAGMILHLESSVAEPVRYKFKRYFITTMFIVTTMYVSFGSCGYASFGKETNQIITLNLPQGESLDFSMIVKSCLCLALFFTYPVMMFPVMQILDGYLIWEPDNNKGKGNVLRISMVLLTGLIVLMIPSFTNIMALVGATCCTLLAFTLPGLFHMTIFKGSLSKLQVSFDWFLVILGVIGAIIGTLDTLNRLAKTAEVQVPRDILANHTAVAATGES
ncbi:uncharacterized protein LOC132724732 isoform X2 [Ruditapes philippinarum]|uniref:uncharacterized protein LOC132724732 isoform X2 n=1 Tax=Ruditapes philippinarum TaxID=129788 RepID=UPI00295B4982|nr:uncharacterized protein LOC132724732 isoform X2 [Ruditapes philippinarum]